MRSAKIDFLSERKPLHVGILSGQPEILVQLLEFLAAHVGEPVSQNVLAGAVEQENDAVEVRGNQTAAHGVNDVLREILKAEKFLALFLKFAAFAAERMDKQAGQICDGQESEKVHDQPGAQALDGREGRGRARQFPCKGQKCHGGKQGEANGGVEKRDEAGKDDAAHDDDQQIERNEVAFLRAGQVNQERHHHYVAGNLHASMPGCLRQPAKENQVKNSKGDPANDQGEEEPVGAQPRHILGPHNAYGQDERDCQKAYARQPFQPCFRRKTLVHGFPAPPNAFRASPSPGRKQRAESCSPPSAEVFDGAGAAGLVIGQLSDKREQRQVHGNNHAADHQA